MTVERLAFLIVLFVVGAMWLFQGRQTSDAEAHAKEWQDTAQARLLNLKATQRKTDSLEQRLTLERSRTDTVILRERVVEREGEARFAAAGDSLIATLDSILVVASETAPLVKVARMQVRDRDAEHKTVADAIRAQMQAVVALQATTDSARGAWRERAIAAETWGEAAATEARAWERAYHEKQGSGLSLVDRILPEGKARTAGKVVLCGGSGEGTRRVTGSVEAAIGVAVGCIVGAFVF